MKSESNNSSSNFWYRLSVFSSQNCIYLLRGGRFLSIPYHWKSFASSAVLHGIIFQVPDWMYSEINFSADNGCTDVFRDPEGLFVVWISKPIFSAIVFLKADDSTFPVQCCRTRDLILFESPIYCSTIPTSQPWLFLLFRLVNVSKRRFFSESPFLVIFFLWHWLSIPKVSHNIVE